jgi:hypothetical protein
MAYAHRTQNFSILVMVGPGHEEQADREWSA